MKKIILLAAVASMLLIASCSSRSTSEYLPGNTQEDIPTYEGKIVEVNDGYIMLAEGGTDLCTVGTMDIPISDWKNNERNPMDLTAGMLVQVEYDGTIMETYPCKLSNPTALRIMGSEDDMVGFYMEAINQLYDTDPALNADISYIAFDFSQLLNMSDSEKSALVWLAAQKYGLEPLTGTFEELHKQGYISEDKMRFEDGILFEIKDEPIKSNRFKFDISKWRSGRGAYMFNDCTAVRGDIGWTFTIGSEAIS